MQQKVTKPEFIQSPPRVNAEESIRIAVRDRIKAELPTEVGVADYLNSETGARRLAEILSEEYLKEKKLVADYLEDSELNKIAQELKSHFDSVKSWLLDGALVEFRDIVPAVELPNSNFNMEKQSNPANLITYKYTSLTQPGAKEKVATPQTDAYLQGLFKNVGGVLHEMRSSLTIFNTLNRLFPENDKKQIEFQYERDESAKKEALKSISRIFTRLLDKNTSLRDDLMQMHPTYGQGPSEWTIKYLEKVFEPVATRILNASFPLRDGPMLEFIRQEDFTPEERAFVFFVHLLSFLVPIESAFWGENFDQRFSYLNPDIINEVPDSILYKLDAGIKDNEKKASKMVQEGMEELLKWYCSGNFSVFYSEKALFRADRIRHFGEEGFEKPLEAEVTSFLAGRPKQYSSIKDVGERADYILELLREFSRMYIVFTKSEIKAYGSGRQIEVVDYRQASLQRRWSVRKMVAAAAAAMATLLGANSMLSGNAKMSEGSAQTITIGLNEKLRQIQYESVFMENIRKLKGEEILKLDVNTLLRVFSGNDNAKGNKLVYLLGANESGWGERKLTKKQVIEVLKKLEAGVKLEERNSFYKIVGEKFALDIKKAN